MKRLLLLVCLLVGCATAPHQYRPPVPPLTPPPDPTMFYIEGSSDIFNTTILYRESILAYSQYLASYAEKLNVELGIPTPPKVSAIVKDTTVCKSLLGTFPSMKMPNPPDVNGYSAEEVVNALVSYIEDITSRAEAYKEAIDLKKKELADKC